MSLTLHKKSLRLFEIEEGSLNKSKSESRVKR